MRRSRLVPDLEDTLNRLAFIGLIALLNAILAALEVVEHAAAEAAAADPDIGTASAAGWESTMRDTAARGEAFFSLNRYIFTARRPAI